MKKNLLGGLGVMALGVLVAITPRFLFPICEYNGIFMKMPMGNDHMHCYYTALAAYVVGALMCLIGLALVLAKTREAIQSLSLVLGGVALAVIMTPVIFPICNNPDEPCNHGTKPLIIVLGITTLAVSGWMLLSSRKSTAAYTVSAADAA